MEYLDSIRSIAAFPDAVPVDELLTTFKTTAESNWERASVLNRDNVAVIKDNRSNYRFFISSRSEPELKRADQILFNCFHEKIVRYSEDQKHVHIKSDEGYAILRYQLNQEYRPHIDFSEGTARLISGLLYLNSDFEGGELHFTRFDITVKPQPGLLLLFPSNFLFEHASLPVRSGTKYAVVTWFR